MAHDDRQRPSGRLAPDADTPAAPQPANKVTRSALSAPATNARAASPGAFADARATSRDDWDPTTVMAALTGEPASAGEGTLTADDAATLAVERKGSGRAVDDGLAAKVTEQVGVDVSSARVHDDRLAHGAARAIGARAFAHEDDIFLGEGESELDAELMAHELTHVAQVRVLRAAPGVRGAASGAAAWRAKVTVGAADHPAERHADAVARQVVAGAQPAAPAPLLMDDDANAAAAPRTMRKGAFLAALRPAVQAAVEAELAATGATDGCPYLERVFAHYAAAPAAAAESLLLRWIPDARAAASAHDLLPMVIARVLQGVRAWRATGQLPAEVLAAAPQLAQQAADETAPPVAGSLDALEAELGPGQPLDATTQRRMAEGLGADVSSARLHTGALAHSKAEQHQAVAFAVGPNIVLGARAPQLDSPAGQALLAHELAHTLQQRDAAQDAHARRRPIAPESAAAEQDADQAGAQALATAAQAGASPAAMPESASVAGLVLLARRFGEVMRTDVALQRCSGGVDPKFTAAKAVGPDVGRPVAVSNPSGSTWFNRRQLTAGATLGAAPDEALALALARTLHRDAAVIPAQGQYFVYAIEGAGDLDLELVYGGNAGIRIEAGVAALVNEKGLTYHASDLASARDHAQPADGASADPFAAYQALHQARGGIEGLGEAELVATFEAAMFDTALAVLAESEVQAVRKAQQLGAQGATSPAEHGEIDATAREALRLQLQLEQTERHLHTIQSTPADPDTHDHPPGWFDDLPRLQQETTKLTTAKRQLLQRYPMLGRYRSSAELQAFLARPAKERERALASDARSVLMDIDTTRRNLQSGELNLWNLSSVVDATIAGLGIGKDSPQRARIEAKAKAQRTKEAVLNLALAVFSIGFGLAGAFMTGGTSLAFTAGAVGLGAYDAVTTTEDYFAQNAATNTDLDPDGGILPAEARMHWGWLVAAWAGVALDFADVLKAARVAEEVGHVARGGKSIREAAEALAHGDARLLERLRRAAGDAALTDTLSEAMRPTISARIGAEIVVDGNLGNDVKVIYEVGAGGKTSVAHVRVGPGAKVGDILAHTDTIAMLNRYSGLTGKVRQVWDRLRSFAGMGKAAQNPFPAGSQAFNSWHELEKLQQLMGYRRHLLQELLHKSPTATEAQVALRKELDFLENEFDVHQRAVDALVHERGPGAISMTEATKDALTAGHHLPDFPGKTAAELSADDLKSSAWYFERQDDGSFLLKQKVDKQAPQVPVTTPAPKLSEAMQHAKSVAGSATKDSLKKHIMEPAEFAAAEARIRPLVEAAIAETYDKAVAAGKTVKQARDDATKVGRELARSEAIEAGKEVAFARAKKSLADGTAFDPAKLDADTTAQLARHKNTVLDGHRLAPLLTDKKEADFLSTMAGEVSNGRVPPPRTISIGGPPPQPMTMWEYPDGTVVRYKPLGDKHRVTPAFSIEMKKNPALPDNGSTDVAFKVTADGHASPRSYEYIANPYSKAQHDKQNKAFEDAIMKLVHFELEK
ncbi:MAG: DUF4157 domain-containing protein [Myxococcales bacterium]|nr:DUF4157 domain-containing protein [Myxococcales bacterium]